MTNKALQPVEQKTVLFYDDEITAVRLQDGRVYIPLRPVCDLLGIDWSAQRQRINRDPILSEVVSGVVVTPSPLAESKFANPQEMLCIPLDFLNGWLFGINANRVSDAVRPTLLRYQRECYQVLYEATQEGRLSVDTDVDIETLLQQDSPAVQAYQMVLAMVKMARQQVIMEAQLQVHGQALDEYGERLDQLESAVGGKHITEAQASQISQAVKAIAITLGKKTKRNEFGAVYGELYRRFNVASYKAIPQRKFDEVMTFLNEWLQSLVGDTPF